MLMTATRSAQSTGGYSAPTHVRTARLRDLLQSATRVRDWNNGQLELFKAAGIDPGMILFTAGDTALLAGPCVSIVGSREASPAGRTRAARLARELVERRIVVVSGLAKGIDAAAHSSAIETGGSTIGVLGTPLSKATPVENGPLQEAIWRDHLLISPFAEGSRVYPGNFPKRNRVMAAISDATVIAEAADNSGSLHQAVACQKLGRWLFIMKNVVDNQRWPKRFLNAKYTVILEGTDQITHALGV